MHRNAGFHHPIPTMGILLPTGKISDIDALTKYVAIYGAKGLAYFQISDENEVKSPLLKFFARSGNIFPYRQRSVAV